MAAWVTSALRWDHIGTVIAVLAFALSILNLWRGFTSDARAVAAETRSIAAEARAVDAEKRSLQADQQSLELAFASEKQTALLAIRQEVLSFRSQTRKLEALKFDAQSVHADKIIDEVDNHLANIGRQLKLFEVIRGVIDVSPKNVKYNDLLTLREAITKMNEIFESAEQKNESFDFDYRSARTRIQLFTDCIRGNIDPDGVAKGELRPLDDSKPMLIPPGSELERRQQMLDR